MNIHLKPLSKQVMVITGASSGIGLATAIMAAKAGVKLVLTARNKKALDEIAEKLNKAGAEVEIVAADIGVEQDVQKVADAAIKRFGRIDTWVNNAGVDIWGRLEQVSDEDSQRLFKTNFWGTVYGSKIAVSHFKKTGGALINVGSVASDRGFPLQGIYCASKHAVKSYTETLRSELQEEGAPVSITLIKPASVGTPLPKQCKNYLEFEPKLPSPVYAPEEVAIAILYAAVNPVRDIYVGFAGKVISTLGRFFPKITDIIAVKLLFSAQKRDVRARERVDNLHTAGPRGGLVSEDALNRPIMPSLYTRSVLHPMELATALGAIGFIGYAAFAKMRKQ